MLNPFTPRYGHSPKVLAGRESEIDAFREAMDSLQHGPAFQDLCLIGPRGNGKTSLLNRLAEMCGGGRSRTIRMAAESLSTPAQFAASFASEANQDHSGFNLSKIKGGFGKWIQAEFERDKRVDVDDPSSVQPVVQVLRKAFDYEDGERVEPLTLCVDEAHEASLLVMKGLFTAAQEFSDKRKAPFLLVVAGTPVLRRRMNDAGVTFSGRVKELRIGRITPEATREALSETLSSANVDIEPAALNRAVRETHCYPYFIQLLGKCMFDRVMQSGSGVVGERELRSSLVNYSDSKESYYQGRLDELHSRSLVEAAVAAGSKFKSINQSIRRESVVDHMVERGIDEAEEKFERLHDLGFVWTGLRDKVTLGIPSLSTYVRRTSPRIVRAQQARRDRSGR